MANEVLFHLDNVFDFDLNRFLEFFISQVSIVISDFLSDNL